jgi:hypothetical protein
MRRRLRSLALSLPALSLLALSLLALSMIAPIAMFDLRSWKLHRLRISVRR